MRVKTNLLRMRRILTLIVAILSLTLVTENTRAAQGATPQQPTRSTPSEPAPPCMDQISMDQLEKSVKQLTAGVEVLAKRVSDLEKERLFDVTRVLLVGEEARAEALQGKLRESMERQLILQARLELVDNQLRPEAIERLFVGIGSVRPEEGREAVRRRLSVEKQGIVAQLDLVRQERNRFQASLATADMTIQRLRMRLAEAGRP